MKHKTPTLRGAGALSMQEINAVSADFVLLAGLIVKLRFLSLCNRVTLEVCMACLFWLRFHLPSLQSIGGAPWPTH